MTRLQFIASLIAAPFAWAFGRKSVAEATEQSFHIGMPVLAGAPQLPRQSSAANWIGSRGHIHDGVEMDLELLVHWRDAQTGERLLNLFWCRNSGCVWVGSENSADLTRFRRFPDWDAIRPFVLGIPGRRRCVPFATGASYLTLMVAVTGVSGDSRLLFGKHMTPTLYGEPVRFVPETEMLTA